MRFGHAAAVAAVALAVTVVPAAHGRSSDAVQHLTNFSLGCDPAVLSGGYCSGVYTQEVETFGALKAQVAADSSNCPVAYEYAFDNGPWSAAVGGHSNFGPVAPGKHSVQIRAKNTSPPPPNNFACALTRFAGRALIDVTHARVSQLDLSFGDRIAAARRNVQARVVQFGQQKVEHERRVEAAQGRIEAALQATRVHNVRLFERDREYRRIRAALARLYAATPRPRDASEGFAQALRQTGDRIAALESEIVARTRSGSGLGDLARRLTRARADFVELSRGLEARRPAANRDLRRRWQAALRDQRDDMHRLRVAGAQADYDRGRAEADALELLKERTTLDRQAFELAEEIALFSYDVHEIRITADGELVYHAVGTRNDVLRLQSLNTRLDETQKALTEIAEVRERIKKAHEAANKDLIKAEALVAGRIMSSAGWRALVDGVFYLWDVGSAFAKGGPIGALTTATQKLIEGTLSGAMEFQGVDPKSIEAELNAAYDRGIVEAISGRKLGIMAGERLVKETAIKAGRDRLNKEIAETLLGPFGAPVPPAGPAVFSRKLPSLADIQAWRRAPRWFGTTEQQLKTLRRGASLNRGTIGGITEGMFRDLGKSFFKTAIDEFERAAWVDFFQKDILARAQFPLLWAAHDLYWEAHDAHDELLAEKAEILAKGMDPQTGYRVLVAKPFRPSAQLEVVLQLSTLTQRTAPPAVEVGRAPAQLVGRSADRTAATYRVAASGVQTAAEGLATLALR